MTETASTNKQTVTLQNQAKHFFSQDEQHMLLEKLLSSYPARKRALLLSRLAAYAAREAALFLSCS